MRGLLGEKGCRGEGCGMWVGGGCEWVSFYCMEEILRSLEAGGTWKEAMRKCCRLNKLNVEVVAYFTPLRLRHAHNKFREIYARRPPEDSQRWLENELKAFYWTTVAVSCMTATLISAFDHSHWQQLAQVFPQKQCLTLEYEGRKLVEDPAGRQGWEAQEEAQLAAIVSREQTASNHWNEFARQLYEQSEKRYFRTGKQCRQRWLNHLDPSKKHGEWTPQEDAEVVRLFLTEGRRWSKVAKQLGSQRTEHMVKNRHKTLLARQKRLHPHLTNDNALLRTFLQLPTPVKTEPKSQQLLPTQEKLPECAPAVPCPSPAHSSSSLNLSGVQVQVQVSRGGAGPYELPQVYSPWYVGIPLTPTFSPNISFFVNLPNFSSFQASFTNQFYCPKVEKPAEH